MKKTLLTTLLSICFVIAAYSQTPFGPEQTINGATGANPFAIDSGDLNGNTFIDIVIGTDAGHTVEWYTNDGSGVFTKQTNLPSALLNVDGVHIANLDGINGNDIIATGFGNDKIVWFANDGSVGGGFGPEILIATLDGVGQVLTADINNDGNLDLIAVGYNANKVVWYEGNGTGGFVSEQIIESGTLQPGAISIIDFDDDTDLDIVIGYTGAGTIEVYYNQFFGSGTVSWVKDPHQVDSGNQSLFVVAFADIDDDGSLDIIKSDAVGTATPTGNEIAWFKKEGDGTYTKTIIPTSINKPAVVMVRDLNNDGYTDIIVSNGTLGSPDDIIWFESTGAGTYFSEATISLFSDQKQTYGFTVADFDGDGDLDIASVNYGGTELSWFENKLITLSLNDNSIQKISIYPNPTTNKLYFKGSFNDNFKVSVFDILGKKIIEKTLNINETLDVSQLNTGIYIIRFDEFNTTYKFVKE